MMWVLQRSNSYRQNPPPPIFRIISPPRRESVSAILGFIATVEVFLERLQPFTRSKKSVHRLLNVPYQIEIVQKVGIVRHPSLSTFN